MVACRSVCSSVVMAQMEFRHTEREVTEAYLFGIGWIEAERQRDQCGNLLGMALLQFQETQSLQRSRMVGIKRQRALHGLFRFIDSSLRRKHQASHVVGAGIVRLQRQRSFDRLRSQRDLIMGILARAV